MISPFRVLKKIGDNAYKIALPMDINISSIFNVVDIFEISFARLSSRLAPIHFKF